MKLNESSWWQQPLGKTYGLWCQMVNDWMASAYVTEWQVPNSEWSKIICNRRLHESSDRTDFTTLKLHWQLKVELA